MDWTTPLQPKPEVATREIDGSTYIDVTACPDIRAALPRFEFEIPDNAVEVLIPISLYNRIVTPFEPQSWRIEVRYQ